MESEVRYCTADDGVRIAYTVVGKGPPLVVAPSFVESFSLEHLFPARQPFMRELGRGRTVVRYDHRGTGLSQRDVADLSLSARILDLEAVIRAARLKRFALFAGVNGCQVAISFAAQHPAKVHRLILYEPIARVKDTATEEVLKGFAELALTNWPVASQILADFPGRRDFPDVTAQLADWWLESTSGEIVGRFILENRDNDVGPLLPRVKAPTLVLYSIGRDAMMEASRQKVAAALPNARSLPLARTHWLLEVGDPESILRAIDAFLKEEGEPLATTGVDQAGAPSAFRTVLFTDVEGSTALTQRLGDARAREVLRQHERIVREALKAHGGSEVKTTGDGFMTSFSSATRALESAIAMQRAFAAHNESAEEPILVRVGMNAGEPIAEDEDLFGTAVIEAARIAAVAKGGEILVSNVVRELAKGKEFVFVDRGDVTLKGFDEPVRLFEVRWEA